MVYGSSRRLRTDSRACRSATTRSFSSKRRDSASSTSSFRRWKEAATAAGSARVSVSVSIPANAAMVCTEAARRASRSCAREKLRRSARRRIARQSSKDSRPADLSYSFVLDGKRIEREAEDPPAQRSMLSDDDHHKEHKQTFSQVILRMLLLRCDPRVRRVRSIVAPASEGHLGRALSGRTRELLRGRRLTVNFSSSSERTVAFMTPSMPSEVDDGGDTAPRPSNGHVLILPPHSSPPLRPRPRASGAVPRRRPHCNRRDDGSPYHLRLDRSPPDRRAQPRRAMGCATSLPREHLRRGFSDGTKSGEDALQRGCRPRRGGTRQDDRGDAREEQRGRMGHCLEVGRRYVCQQRS